MKKVLTVLIAFNVLFGTVSCGTLDQLVRNQESVEHEIEMVVETPSIVEEKTAEEFATVIEGVEETSVETVSEAVDEVIETEAEEINEILTSISDVVAEEVKESSSTEKKSEDFKVEIVSNNDKAEKKLADVENKTEKKSSAGLIILLVIVVAVAAAAVYYFLVFRRKETID